MTSAARTMAVVVGIEQYGAGDSWRLNGPALDACRFANWLISRGVPSSQITTLISPLPENRAAVREQLSGIRIRTASHMTVRKVFTKFLPSSTSDLLIVFWGGHGVLDQEQRRLMYADATTADKKNLNLSSLLSSMRSSTFAGHPHQIVLVDACMNLASQLGWEGTMPNEKFSSARPEPERDQRVLLAASQGERAVNLDALRTGLFSRVVQDELYAVPARSWPPDMNQVRDRVDEHFQRLRETGTTRQTPSHIWFLSRSGEDMFFTASPTMARGGAGAFGAQLLGFAERRELTAILDGAPAPRNLRGLYRQATRDVVGLRPPSQPDDLIETMEALRQPLSALPLFKFLVYFAAVSDAVTEQKLWEWLGKTAPSWGVDLRELRALKMELGRSSFLLRIRRDVLGSGLMLTGWRYEGSRAEQIIADDEPRDWTALAAKVGTLVKQIDRNPDIVLPLVEFLVPVSMLDAPFDALPVTTDDGPTTIGSVLPVVVRPADRDADEQGKKFHRDAWDELASRCTSYDESAICWLESASDLAAFTSRVCAAFAYERSLVPDVDPLFRAALSTGFPVAVWHRPSGARRPSRDTLEEVLRSRALQKLPDIVLRQRSSAGHPQAAPDHAGRDLVLLWDDPYRVPAERELRPPMQDGDLG